MSAVSITTVIPAYNEGDRLVAFLDDWAATGIHHASHVTAIVVDDGSAAKKRAAARGGGRGGAPAAESRAGHRIVYLRADRNQGKGASIRWGWSQADATATWLSFIDADGAVPAREYWRVASMLPDTPADVVCGSRMKMAGRSVSRSLFRHLQGRTFATVVDELFHLGFYDTQCGMKFFRAVAAAPAAACLQEDRWLLDVEVLSLLKARRDCVEVPIDCHERGGSSLASVSIRSRW